MIKTVESKLAPEAIGPYSQAKVFDGILYTSGQIPLNLEGQVVDGGITEQATQVMHNLSAVLAEAGTDFNNVIKTTCYLSSMEDFAAFNKIYAEYFTSNPARSCVAVKELPKGVLVEVEVIVSCKK